MIDVLSLQVKLTRYKDTVNYKGLWGELQVAERQFEISQET
jgi:hypothetical protein